ncbi:hypothetical protein BDV11DRAFT_200329 [Aspergillus similis]
MDAARFPSGRGSKVWKRIIEVPAVFRLRIVWKKRAQVCRTSSTLERQHSTRSSSVLENKLRHISRSLTTPYGTLSSHQAVLAAEKQAISAQTAVVLGY